MPTMQDLLKDPGSYGLPTFDQYCKDPDNYRKSFKRMMTELELGPDLYRKDTREIHFWVGINKCRSQERAMDIMLDMGWNPLYIDADIRPETGTAGKLIFNVHFRYQPPQEIKDEQVPSSAE